MFSVMLLCACGKMEMRKTRFRLVRNGRPLSDGDLGTCARCQRCLDDENESLADDPEETWDPVMDEENAGG